MTKEDKRDSNNNIAISKRALILSVLIVASLSVFLITSGPLLSSLLSSSPIKQVRAQQQPSSQSQQPSSQSQQPSSQSQQPSSQSQSSSPTTTSTSAAKPAPKPSPGQCKKQGLEYCADTKNCINPSTQCCNSFQGLLNGGCSLDNLGVQCINNFCECPNGLPLGFDSNCGECGSACTTDRTCIGVPGKCECKSPTEECNGNCVDPATFQSDNNNCGYCGHVCPTGETCQSGQCGSQCPANLPDDCGSGLCCNAACGRPCAGNSCGFSPDTCSSITCNGNTVTQCCPGWAEPACSSSGTAYCATKQSCQ